MASYNSLSSSLFYEFHYWKKNSKKKKLGIESAINMIKAQINRSLCNQYDPIINQSISDKRYRFYQTIAWKIPNWRILNDNNIDNLYQCNTYHSDKCIALWKSIVEFPNCYRVMSTCIDSQKYGHAIVDIYLVDLFSHLLHWTLSAINIIWVLSRYKYMYKKRN